MYGFGWAPLCPKCPTPKLADHADGQGNYYCKTHYNIAVLGYEECMGCLGTGKQHSNSKPVPGGAKCTLCKGAGTLDP